MGKLSRYWVDRRTTCVAVIDSYGANGCNYELTIESPGVVKLWEEKQDSSGNWYVSWDDELAANKLCNELNLKHGDIYGN